MIKTVYVCDWKGCSEEYVVDDDFRGGPPPGWYEVDIVWNNAVKGGDQRRRRRGIVCGKHVDAMPGVLSLPESKP